MIGKISHFHYCLCSIISWLCVWSTYFGLEIDHKQWKASIIIHFVDKPMQVMIHFHLTPPLMFQYAPQLITVYSTTIMLVLIMHNCTMDIRRHWCGASTFSCTFYIKDLLGHQSYIINYFHNPTYCVKRNNLSC